MSDEIVALFPAPTALGVAPEPVSGLQPGRPVAGAKDAGLKVLYVLRRSRANVLLAEWRAAGDAAAAARRSERLAELRDLLRLRLLRRRLVVDGYLLRTKNMRHSFKCSQQLRIPRTESASYILSGEGTRDRTCI